ncbi:MAG: TIGR04282 family arsenosugar biosynthesis glycosyltransferase [Thermoleophilia bacterium]|nr:TIGR04282 family arsenosugar biosynthesis glycosyltransferase [Thermoleophilia bacterium]
MTGTVLLVAKAPLPGRSKTRLVPPLSAEQAARLHEALLLDTLDACRAEAPVVGLLHGEAGDAPALAALAGAETPLVLQEGRGLAAALPGAISRFAGSGPAVLVSADVPGLPRGALGRAFELLAAGADVVLGPALDGGYWLIAMSVHHAEPFRDVPWSTPAVLGVTLARCADAGLRVELLEPWRDVDTLVDLDFLLEELDGLDAPRTVGVLRELERAGLIGGGSPGLRLVEGELLAGTPWRAVVRDRLAGRDGRETSYTYLACPRAVFVVPVTDGGDVVLVRQYRHPVRDWTLEVPAGTVDEGEAPLDAARRELAEEAGGTAREWAHLSTFYSSSAHLSLRSDAYLATGVVLAAAQPAVGEEVTTVRLPLEEAFRRARGGGFAEGQTALALLLAAERLG